MYRILATLSLLLAVMPSMAQVFDDMAPDGDDVALEEFSRDEESVVFVPKGQWITGVSVSYQQSTQDKYQFLIIENLTGDTYTFKVSPMLMFAVRNDLALGGRFAYTRSLTKLENADIVLDPETGYTFDHLYRLSHNCYGTITVSYPPLTLPTTSRG